MKKIYFIVGPTGAGKSDIAFELAKRLGGEIVSADSMQVYKGMDIGTAKASARLRKKIPHHLIDIVFPASSFSAFRFRRLALKALHKIRAKGKVPIVAGGSGLYVRALLEGLSPRPGTNPAFRKKLSQEAKAKGLGVLYQRLQGLDPKSASNIKPADAKRIIRALEIIDAASQSPDGIAGDAREPNVTRVGLRDLGFQPVVIGITKERAELYADIEKRVEAMYRRGLVREVKKLRGERMSKTAREAIGYREILQALQSGVPEKQALIVAKELIKRDTRRFAKRQLTWFKREQGIQWFVRSSGETPETLCDRILG